MATALAGAGMAVQGTANGALAGIVGSGIHAATGSFLGGMIVVLGVAACSPRTRSALRHGWGLIRTGQFPWWMTLGGLAGASVVIAQSFTVPLFGVAMFTMAFVSGQLTGALVVDNTSLPPGGRKPLSFQRILGVLVVLGGVVVSSAGALQHGVSWWAPILPFAAGTMTAFQQAFNGRFKLATNSAGAATFLNFFVGSVFLVACSAALALAGSGVTAAPELPGQWWTLIGGVLGVLFIGVTTITVEHLGVLILSLTSLFGNLLGSLIIDLAFPTAEAPITWATYLAMALVLLGVSIASLPGRRPRQVHRLRLDEEPPEDSGPELQR
nr:DMT family transporter [Brevibacterium daeguense]